MPDSDSRRLDAWLDSVDALLSEYPDTHADDCRSAFAGKTWSRLGKERDLELHLRTGWLFGGEYVELADFVPSTGTYENRVLIEGRLLRELLQQLHGLQRHLGGDSRVA